MALARTSQKPPQQRVASAGRLVGEFMEERQAVVADIGAEPLELRVGAVHSRRPFEALVREQGSNETERRRYENLDHATGKRRAIEAEQDFVPLHEEGPERRQLGVTREVAQVVANIQFDALGHVGAQVAECLLLAFEIAVPRRLLCKA